jgi:Protein of unknown function (DUF2924)
MPTKGHVTSRLAELPNLCKSDLRAEWQRLFGRPAPDALRKDLMVRVLAYRIQEWHFGNLKPATSKRLQQIAKACAAHPRAPLSDLPAFKSGTRLVRAWNGKPHVVTVIEDGFEYAGSCYSSLSRVARLITGTRWSGPLFFGLRGGHIKEHRDAQRN